MHILGLSAYYHDSAAAILRDGEIVAAMQEERFSRKKHDPLFPLHAVRHCLKEAGVSVAELDYVVFYDKPFIKFERLLETYLARAPKGFVSFIASMPLWLREKLFLKQTLKNKLAQIGGCKKDELPPLFFSEHHQAHAASAFFPSPFSKAAVLCLDGVGEWATTTAWSAEENRLTPLWEINFPHSLGLLYSAFTYFTGFKVNSGEYKLMGLAPYGSPKYRQLILDQLIDIKADGTFRLNIDYFNFLTGLTMTNRRFDRLFGGPPRRPESPITQREMDIASSIQAVTEEVMLRLARTLKRETGHAYLCLAGGVALNCVANGRILREGIFEKIWIQPAAGDAGGALGAALALWHQYLERPRQSNQDRQDAMRGALLGLRISDSEIAADLDRMGANYSRLQEEKLLDSVAELLANEKVVGWFQGRMEFGPRALGCRSILGDPRSSRMQSMMNLKIKFRESFRPFAPAVLAEEMPNYFDLETASPYMLLVAPLCQKVRRPLQEGEQALNGLEKLKAVRSSIPAVTHVDYSARVQSVERPTNPRFYDLLCAFKQKTGCGVLVNTSFNVRGEPIVCTVLDAYRCFMRTEMDYLVLEDCLLDKREQPQTDWPKAGATEFEPD